MLLSGIQPFTEPLKGGVAKHEPICVVLDQLDQKKHNSLFHVSYKIKADVKNINK